MKRISTGIPSDEMIDGGYPFPSTILICGEPGTGKTTFAVQSLFHGGRKGERSLFISTIAEPTDSIKRFLSGFTFYSQEVVDKGDMIFTDVGDTLRKEPAEISGVIKRAVYEYKPKRISIDTLTAIKDILGPTGFREFIYDLLQLTKESETLTLVTVEFPEGEIPKHMESYLVDGIISLIFTPERIHRYRDLSVIKMRGTQHLLDTLRYEIDSNGLRVLRVPI